LSLLAYGVRFHLGDHLVQDFREVGWAVKIGVLNCMLVGADDFLKAIDLGVEDVSVQGEAVRSPLTVGWDSATETIKRNLFVRVVKLEDFANVSNRLNVLIALGIKVVKRRSIIRSSIRKCEVDCNRQVNFTTTEDVLDEGMNALNFEAIELDGARGIQLVITLTFLKHSQCDLAAAAEDSVLARGRRSEELNLNLTLDIVLAKICRPDLNLIPSEEALLSLFYLRFVNRNVLAQADTLVKDEERETAHVFQLRFRGELNHLGVRCGFLLVSVHLNSARFSNFWVVQRFQEGLVRACHNFV
jgi:hypothetical protein